MGNGIFEADEEEARPSHHCGPHDHLLKSRYLERDSRPENGLGCQLMLAVRLHSQHIHRSILYIYVLYIFHDGYQLYIDLPIGCTYYVGVPFLDMPILRLSALFRSIRHGSIHTIVRTHFLLFFGARCLEGCSANLFVLISSGWCFTQLVCLKPQDA